MKKCIVCLALIVGMLAYAQQAQAAVILDFNMDATHPVGASISYAGGAAPLVGSNISVDLVQIAGDGTSVRTIFGGILSFSTGALSSYDASHWYFNTGGSLLLTGGVDLDKDGVISGTDIPLGSKLIVGSFAGMPNVQVNYGDFRIFGTGIVDVKDETLAKFYGFGKDGLGYGWGGAINLSFQASGTPNSAFSSQIVGSGDIFNEAKTPEPGSAALLGMGLIGFVGMLRRKFMA